MKNITCCSGHYVISDYRGNSSSPKVGMGRRGHNDKKQASLKQMSNLLRPFSSLFSAR